MCRVTECGLIERPDGAYLAPQRSRWYGRRLFCFPDTLPGYLICLTPRSRKFVGFALHPQTVWAWEIDALTWILMGNDPIKLLTA